MFSDLISSSLVMNIIRARTRDKSSMTTLEGLLHRDGKPIYLQMVFNTRSLFNYEF